MAFKVMQRAFAVLSPDGTSPSTPWRTPRISTKSSTGSTAERSRAQTRRFKVCYAAKRLLPDNQSRAERARRRKNLAGLDAFRGSQLALTGDDDPAKCRKKWCPGAELNHRHRDFQSRALPTELPGRRTPPERRGEQSARVIEARFRAVHRRSCGDFQPAGTTSGPLRRTPSSGVRGTVCTITPCRRAAVRAPAPASRHPIPPPGSRMCRRTSDAGRRPCSARNRTAGSARPRACRRVGEDQKRFASRRTDRPSGGIEKSAKCRPLGYPRR